MPNDELSNQSEALYWKFDVSTFRLLGRELITDRITALFELVKNCYDANATKVTIKFIDINPITSNSKIIIKDNGIGMSIMI
jgi:DNA mismatch repair ATPase MutL